MTPLQEIREDLVVVSGEPKSRNFREGDGDFLWTREVIPIPIQLHYHPLGKAEEAVDGDARGDGRPVLLLHGASAGADTFLRPELGGGCFVDHLLRENYEPWLLDWRASKDVAETIIKLRRGKDVELGLPAKVAAKIKGQYAKKEGEVFEQLNFNAAAEHDITRALEAIRVLRPGKKIDIVAHCMGSAITAEALVRELLDLYIAEGKDEGLSHVVLSTIGVFYQMNFHGRLKAEAHLLKRVEGETGGPYHFLDPRIDPDSQEPRRQPMRPWPPFIEVLYGAWNVAYDQERLEREGIPERDRHVFEMFNRLSFMFGEPYQEGNLAPEFHHHLQAITFEPPRENALPIVIPAGSAISVVDNDMNETPMGEAAYDFRSERDNELLIYRSEKDFVEGQLLSTDGLVVGHVGSILTDKDKHGPLLPALFGPMSLDLFRHGAENLRAGMATTLKEGAKKDDEDDGLEPTPLLNGNEEEGFASFEKLDRVTLIGGGLNRLWHRDCIDRMADWLDRSQVIREKCQKTMLLDYGHQDLFWGRESAKAVFPKIVDGLGPGTPEDGQEKRDGEKGDPEGRPNLAV